jgi:hypothetical protein
VKSLCEPALAWCRNLVAGWDRFWFTPADPATLAAVRICTGLVLLYTHLTCTSDLLSLVGPDAWVDARAIEQLRAMGGDAPDSYSRLAGGWWGQSLWFYVQSPAAILALHLCFLAAVVCFTLGLFSRAASVVVWAGHLSHIHRGFTIYFGLDCVLAMLTFYLMFAPTGSALSLDRLRRWRSANGPPQPSRAANVVIRLIQVHMAIIYLCAGLSKLQGSRWWDGTAVWSVMMLHEYAPVDASGLAHWGDLACLVVSNLGVVLTLFLEISFAFLIWNPSWRPVLLFLAVVMHAGIGLFMGMGSFGAAMLTGCLAFVAPATVRRLAEACRRRLPGRAVAAPARSGRRAA